MRHLLPLIMLLFFQTAVADEVLCSRPPHSPPRLQMELGEQFRLIADRARIWAEAERFPSVCRVAMSDSKALADAAVNHYVVFVLGAIALCDRNDPSKFRLVDGSSDPETGEILVNQDAWIGADEAQRTLFATHELAGIARQVSEPWTTSVCWALPAISFGARMVEYPIAFSERPLLLAGGGGASGGRGGGDIQTAGLKFRAYKALVFDLFNGATLDEIKAASRCGIHAGTAFGAWLSLPIDSESVEPGIPVSEAVELRSSVAGSVLMIRGMRSQVRHVGVRQLLDWSYQLLNRTEPSGVDKACLDSLL